MEVAGVDSQAPERFYSSKREARPPNPNRRTNTVEHYVLTHNDGRQKKIVDTQAVQRHTGIIDDATVAGETAPEP